MESELLLRALSNCLHMPLLVLNERFVLCKYYNALETDFSYDYQTLFTDLEKKGQKYALITGKLNELLLLYAFSDHYFIFGPFRCNLTDRNVLYKYLDALNTPLAQYELTYTQLAALPIYCLDDIRDIIYLINYLFTGETTDQLVNPKFQQLTQTTSLLNKKRRILLTQASFSYAQIYQHEKKILMCIKKNEPRQLSEFIQTISWSELGHTLGPDLLRTQKDYLIVLLEKVTHLAIKSQLSPAKSKRLQNIFIAEVELCTTTAQLIETCTTALLLFTQEIAERQEKIRSPLIDQIIEYIKNNLNAPLQIDELCARFDLSQARLKYLFKTELQMTIRQYIILQKITVAKQLLCTGSDIQKLPQTLGFSDYAHFAKTFKRLTGMTPKQFSQSYQV
ncbi:YSIRK-targeted surface antigen transcriptional regulator [Ligilactobacillus murinus]|uniref:YSIRK-targeted surface antigen transcriptional regulator n=1 Tax=Ligilactobacillus murinus TaxID=1622 RepID=UPI003511FF0C